MKHFLTAAAAASMSFAAMPALAQDDAAAPMSTAPAAEAELVEMSCAIVGKEAGAEKSNVYAAPDLSVLAMTRDHDGLKLDTAEGFETEGILCERNSIVPAPDDYKAPKSGYPLYVETYDGEEKTGVSKLVLEDGVYGYEVLLGELTDAERATADARIAAYNAQTEG